MADNIDSEERELYIYMNQIQHLDKELERCQHECDDLEKRYKDLDSRYRMLEVDKEDITECLKYSLAESKRNTNKLTEHLESQQQGIEQDGEALKLQHSQGTQELQELQERVDELKGRLDELDSACMMQVAKFEEQEGLPMQQLAFLEFLEKQMKENNAAFNRLSTESILEENKAAKENMDVTELATSDIVQRERAQHAQQSERLHNLLYDSYDVFKRRDFLEKQLQHASRENKKKTAGNATPWREIHLNRCHHLEARTKHYRTTQEHKLAKDKNLRRDLASESEECCQHTAKASELEADHQRDRSKRRELEGVMWEGVTILRQIVMGSKKASDTHSKKQRLREVLEILKAPLTSAEIPDLPTDPSFLLIRYRVGDLGLVPRPTWKRKPAVSTRTKLLPTSRKTFSSADPSSPAPQSISLED